MTSFKFSNLKLRWLIYTVLFGMAPIFLRLLVGSLVVGDKVVVYFSASDFIAFGIVLQVSIYNEIRYHDLSDADWKHRMMGVSALFMLFYSGLYVMLLISEVFEGINLSALLYSSMISSMVSLLLCLCFYDRMSRSSDEIG
ncbi:hypothetical protein [Pseudomonas morbosilactucae]|uniref:hypothetical protein n=1 Tax=Pseudomonas morbosilactucae TaxID=2938197 RepID=UPI0022805076|nr:hypothetical protein [Pseudomonas morbosilactucae]